MKINKQKDIKAIVNIIMLSAVAAVDTLQHKISAEMINIAKIMRKTEKSK